MTITTWVICWTSENGERCMLDFEHREDALYMAVKLAESGRGNVTVPVGVDTEIDDARVQAIFDRILAKVHGLPACYAVLEVA